MKRSATFLFFTAAILFLAPAWSYGHSITNIVFNPLSPAEMGFNEHVEISFDYETDEPGGVRIWCYAGPNTMNAGSPLYPVGTGSATTWFTVQSGEITITSVQVYMKDDGQTQTLFDTTTEVSFHFNDQTAFEQSTWGLVKALYR